jgi:hypothetical protein
MIGFENFGQCLQSTRLSSRTNVERYERKLRAWRLEKRHAYEWEMTGLYELHIAIFVVQGSWYLDGLDRTP